MAASVIREASGKRVYVVGDLHGCPDEPATLFEFLKTNEKLADDDLLIFLGDYIDRGPSSRGVIELMLKVKAEFPKTRFLRGNHEDMMIDFLGFGGRCGHAFLMNGGVDTIQSYGISVFASPEEMVATLPPDHFKFLCDLESILVVGDFICVHAGLNPLRDLQTQNDGDVFWIRDEFIANIHPFGKTVVFGHTPRPDVMLDLPWKLGIDTGLVFGNKLSCVELTSGRLFQVTRGQTAIEQSRLDFSALQKKNAA